jgi:hypothetical protein
MTLRRAAHSPLVTAFGRTADASWKEHPSISSCGQHGTDSSLGSAEEDKSEISDASGESVKETGLEHAHTDLKGMSVEALAKHRQVQADKRRATKGSTVRQQHCDVLLRGGCTDCALCGAVLRVGCFVACL